MDYMGAQISLLYIRHGPLLLASVLQPLCYFTFRAGRCYGFHVSETGKKDYRLPVTGWRGWQPEYKYVVVNAIWERVNNFLRAPSYEKFIIIDGECPRGGVDEFAHEYALKLTQTYPGEFGYERYPADFAKLGRKAGPIRNQQMVDAGANICLGFPGPGSRGTWDCLERAVNAGIPTEIVSWNPRWNN